MGRASFLDTGVVIGYCFTVDSHHQPCRKYLRNSGIDFFTSPTVEDEYENAKDRVNRRYANAILEHVAELEKSNIEGELGPIKIDRVKKKILSRNNEAYTSLYHYYENVLPQFANAKEVKTQLREMARDIEHMAITRKQEIDILVRLWRCDEDYPNIRKAFSAIHEPDRTICIEAHDLASNLDDDTELATVNPNDFVRNGRRDLIVNNSAIAEVLSLI